MLQSVPVPPIKPAQAPMLDRLHWLSSVVGDTSHRKVTMSDSISVTNQCYDCMLSDSLCSECLDNQEARASDIAHQMVDDRNLQYSHVWSSTSAQPSGHDWVGATTRVEPYFVFATQSWEDTRSEYVQATTNLADRLTQSWFLGKHIFDMTVEDDELTLPKNYAVCDSCHMMVHAQVICPNCM